MPGRSLVDPPLAKFLTQNPFGGGETPIATVPLSVGANGAPTFRDPALSPLSLGAPVTTPEKGLVGVVVRAVDSVGQVASLSNITDAALSDAITVPDMMRPKEVATGALPPRVDSEIGRLLVFTEQGVLNWIGGFYVLSGGTGFDETFVAAIDFSIKDVSPSSAARRIAGYDKQRALVPVGQQLEAPFRGTSPDYLASCIFHPTPSSDGRSVMVL